MTHINMYSLFIFLTLFQTNNFPHNFAIFMLLVSFRRGFSVCIIILMFPFSLLVFSCIFQQSSVVESLPPTPASVQPPWLERVVMLEEVTAWVLNSSTVSRCLNSSLSCWEQIRTPSAATEPSVASSSQEATAPSWASTIYASWRPGCSSVPLSGCGISPTFLTCPCRSRWPFWGSAGVNCSSWMQLNLLCRCIRPPCWQLPVFIPPPCPLTASCPSWTRCGSSRTRWTSWHDCKWIRPNTAVWKPSLCSHQVRDEPVLKYYLKPVLWNIF